MAVNRLPTDLRDYWKRPIVIQVQSIRKEGFDRTVRIMKMMPIVGI